MRYLLLSLLILKLVTTTAQVLNKKIDLTVKYVPLEDLLLALQQKYDLNFSYGFDNTTGNTPVSIDVKQTSLYSIIQEAARQANLDFSLIGSAIVFKPKTGLVKNTPLESTKPTHVRLTKDSAIFARKHFAFYSPLLITSPDLKLKSIPALPPPIIPFASQPRPSLISHMGVVINYHMEINEYHFKKRDPDFQQYQRHISNNIGVGVFYQFRKINLATALILNGKSFTLNYNYTLFDPDDPFPIPAKTQVSFQYLEIPLALSMVFLKKRNHALTLMGAISYSEKVYHQENTTYLNHANKKTDFFINDSPPRLYSSSIGLIYTYKISSGPSIFIAPSFIFYTDKINEKAMRSQTNTLRFSAGIAYRFIKNVKTQNP